MINGTHCTRIFTLEMKRTFIAGVRFCLFFCKVVGEFGFGWDTKATSVLRLYRGSSSVQVLGLSGFGSVRVLRLLWFGSVKTAMVRFGSGLQLQGFGFGSGTKTTRVRLGSVRVLILQAYQY